MLARGWQLSTQGPIENVRPLSSVFLILLGFERVYVMLYGVHRTRREGSRLHIQLALGQILHLHLHLHLGSDSDSIAHRSPALVEHYIDEVAHHHHHHHYRLSTQPFHRFFWTSVRVHTPPTRPVKYA